MDVWSIPLRPAARPKRPRTTRRTRSPGGGGTSAKRARGSGYTATERSLFNALGTVGRSGAKREDVRSGTEIKVKGLFIRAKTLCAERRQSVHKRFPLDRHQTRERLIKSQDKENCNPPRFLSRRRGASPCPSGELKYSRRPICLAMTLTTSCALSSLAVACSSSTSASSRSNERQKLGRA